MQLPDPPLRVVLQFTVPSSTCTEPLGVAPAPETVKLTV